MSLRRIISGCAVILITAAAVDAQPARVELGLFGEYTSFADSLGFDTGYGGGTRLGLFVFSGFELEGSIAFGATSFAVPASLLEVDGYMPIRARLMYNQRIFGRTYLLVGGEYVNNRYIINSVSTSMNGWGGVLGLRLGLFGSMALRVDGTADYLPDLADLGGAPWNYGLQAGLSFMIGGSDRRGGHGDWDEWSREQPAPSTEVVVTDAGADGDATEAEVEEAGSNGDVAPADAAVPAAIAAEAAADATDARTELDSDGDGIGDVVDQCPNSPAGASVDAGGCSPIPLMVDVTQPADDVAPPAGLSSAIPEGVLHGVTFAPGWWTLDATGEAVLDQLASALLANRSVQIEIIGHTDSTGSTRRNEWLSHYRAEAVKLYLEGRGVARSRIQAKGYGSQQPVASNDTAAGRAKNRRIEIRRMQ